MAFSVTVTVGRASFTAIVAIRDIRVAQVSCFESLVAALSSLIALECIVPMLAIVVSMKFVQELISRKDHPDFHHILAHQGSHRLVVSPLLCFDQHFHYHYSQSSLLLLHYFEGSIDLVLLKPHTLHSSVTAEVMQLEFVAGTRDFTREASSSILIQSIFEFASSF